MTFRKSRYVSTKNKLKQGRTDRINNTLCGLKLTKTCLQKCDNYLENFPDPVENDSSAALCQQIYIPDARSQKTTTLGGNAD